MRWITVAAAVTLTGCASSTSSNPAPLQHVVLFDLKDPADADELMGDCARLLAIPGVRSVVTGPPVSIGRGNVIGDYDAGVLVQIESVAAYRGYLEHPEHEALVQKWRPRWDGVRIYDFGWPCDAGAAVGR